jgi:O-antigen/teichoic acid export membrane protein
MSAAGHSGGFDQRVLTNALWLYADQAVRLVMAITTFSIVARYLGPTGYGVLAFVTAFPAVFLPLAKLGLDFVVVQALVRRAQEKARIMATAATLMFVAGVLSLLMAAAVTGFIQEDHSAKSLLWISIWVLVAQPLLVFDFYFQSKIASRNTVIVRLGTSFISNGCRLALVFGDAELVWFVSLFVLETVILSAGLWLIARRNGVGRFSIFRDFSGHEAKQQLCEAWPLMLAGLAMACYLKFDQLLLSRLAGIEELGLYAAAMRLADMGQLVTYAMITSYFPRLIEIHAQGGKQWGVAIEVFWRQITWLGVAVAVVASIMGPLMLEKLLGTAFGGATLPMVLLVWGNVFAAQIGVRGKWFLAEGMQRHSLYFFLGGAMVHLGGICLFTVSLGALGAALSYLCAQLAMTLVFPLLFAKTRPSVGIALRSFLPFSNAT